MVKLQTQIRCQNVAYDQGLQFATHPAISRWTNSSELDLSGTSDRATDNFGGIWVLNPIRI